VLSSPSTIVPSQPPKPTARGVKGSSPWRPLTRPLALPASSSASQSSRRDSLTPRADHRTPPSRVPSPGQGRCCS
jgi:hypothetical protein